MLATVSDKKEGIDTARGGGVDYYLADVVTANDYYPFGMLMPGRKYAASDLYMYGFNGKEMDNEAKGTGAQYDYGFRIYDPRLVIFLSVDPLSKDYPYYTPYQFAGNTPIQAFDIDGLEPGWVGLKYWLRKKAPILAGTLEGVGESIKGTINFVRRDAWRGETWKQAGLFFEEAILSTSTVKVAETPRVDATVQGFKDEVINGNAYTRSKYLSKVATDILTAYAGSKGTAAIRATAIGIARTELAASFYARAGFTVEKALQHMEGIDFAKAVQTTTLKKGTIIQQWVGENGVGNYFTTLENGAAKNLGISYEGRTLKQFTLTEDTKVLKSTAADYRGNAGGGTQLFSTELKDKIVPATQTP